MDVTTDAQGGDGFRPRRRAQGVECLVELVAVERQRALLYRAHRTQPAEVFTLWRRGPKRSKVAARI